MRYVNKNSSIVILLLLSISLLVFLGSDRRVSIDIDLTEQEEVVDELKNDEELQPISLINKYIDSCETWGKDGMLTSRDGDCSSLFDIEMASYYYIEDTCDNVGFTFYFSEPVQIVFFIIQNLVDDKEFSKNSKPREIEYHNYTFELDNTNESQWVEVEDSVTEEITILITSSYPGEISSEGDSTVSGCGVQEIEFFGKTQ